MKRLAFLLLAMAGALPLPSRGEPYAVLDKAGAIQNVIDADAKTPCTPGAGGGSADCTLVLLTTMPLADRGIYGAPQPTPLSDLVCDPGGVKYDGNFLVVCSTTGKSTATLPGPLVKPVE